jgi:threonine dehydratase
LKLENLQVTGSFKARGAFSKLLSLTGDQRRRGCVTASTGNHGAAVSYALRQIGASGLIFIPEKTSPVKVQAIESYGSQIRVHGRDGALTEQYARAYADREELVYISPYNDLQVIGGQGTIGVELEQQIDTIDHLFISLGGGGLISGVAGYLKSTMTQINITGCSPLNSQVMFESVRAGHILELESLPTLSDGTAGGIEPGAITFDMCRTLIDDFESVSEDEIGEGMRRILDAHHLLIEGSAGVAVAAFLKRAPALAGKKVVILICGANISRESLKTVL